MPLLPLTHPLSAHTARAAIRHVLRVGVLHVTQHAVTEMANDNLSLAQCQRVLRRGFVDETRTVWQRGTWRYQVYLPGIAVVVAFDPEDVPTTVTIVTAWRM